MHIIKRITLAITILVIMLASALVFAKITHTLLVLDMPDDAVLPENFRTTADALPDRSNIQLEGLQALHAAGSRQFSSASLTKALEHIPGQSVIVIDLRRESHGIVNGSAVSWYGPQNAANENKSPGEIKMSESRLLSRLKKSHFRWIYQITEKSGDDYINKTHRDFVLIKTVQSEQQLVQEHHLDYQRFYVEDFHGPRDPEVVRFVNLARKLPETTWLYFHCRAGKGRTTTFMSMYDMMKNAKQVSFDDILARQHALGGTDLRELPERSSFKYQYALDRLNFLKKFYEYAKNNNDNFSTTWVQWQRNTRVKSS